ncbi:MAG: trimethylamine methyltransferase family protein [Anaerolineales bacterium]|nr:trimethylamine methyltransferase family protein [Anaerolineales bacterium]
MTDLRAGANDAATARLPKGIQAVTQPINRLPVYELVSEAGLQKINDTSMQILEEVGIDFYDEEALATLKRARCNRQGVDGLF